MSIHHRSHLKTTRMMTTCKGRHNGKTEGTLDLGLLSLLLVSNEEKLLDKTDHVKMAIGLGILTALQISPNLGYVERRSKRQTKKAFFKLKCFY